jgi:hypothetical protein
VATGVIGILAAVRFFLISKRERSRGSIDAALLIAQCVCSGIALLALAADLTRNMPVPELAIQTLAVILPVSATLVGQIVMFATAKKG